MIKVVATTDSWFIQDGVKFIQSFQNQKEADKRADEIRRSITGLIETTQASKSEITLTVRGFLRLVNDMTEESITSDKVCRVRQAIETIKEACLL